MDDFEMYGPAPNATMDEAMALDVKAKALCKLATTADRTKNSAARRWLIEAMDLVLGTMRPPVMLIGFDNFVPPSQTTD